MYAPKCNYRYPSLSHCDHRSSSPWTAVSKLYEPSKLYRLVLDKPFIKSLKFEKNNNSVKPWPGTSCIAIFAVAPITEAPARRPLLTPMSLSSTPDRGTKSTYVQRAVPRCYSRLHQHSQQTGTLPQSFGAQRSSLVIVSIPKFKFPAL